MKRKYLYTVKKTPAAFVSVPSTVRPRIQVLLRKVSEADCQRSDPWFGEILRYVLYCNDVMTGNCDVYDFPPARELTGCSPRSTRHMTFVLLLRGGSLG